MELGEKLALLRKERGLHQRELAEMLHVTRQTVSGWERGTAAPSSEKLLAAARLLGVPLEALLDDKAPLPETDGADRAEVKNAGADTPVQEAPQEAVPERPAAASSREAPAQQPGRRWQKRAALLFAAVFLLLTAAAAAVYLWRTFFPAPEDDIVWQEDMMPEEIDLSEVVDLTENTENLIP